MPRGAPKGNNNASKNKDWQGAIKRALARKGGSVGDGLNLLAEKLVEAALEGERWAIEEIGNRVDGKPAQQQIITGDDDGGPVKTHSIITFIAASED